MKTWSLLLLAACLCIPSLSSAQIIPGNGKAYINIAELPIRQYDSISTDQALAVPDVTDVQEQTEIHVNINVFPNPAVETITLSTEGENMSTITIVNDRGQEILTLTPDAEQANIDVAHLNSGMYTAVVRINNSIQHVRFAITN